MSSEKNTSTGVFWLRHSASASQFVSLVVSMACSWAPILGSSFRLLLVCWGQGDKGFGKSRKATGLNRWPRGECMSSWTARSAKPPEAGGTWWSSRRCTRRGRRHGREHRAMTSVQIRHRDARADARRRLRLAASRCNVWVFIGRCSVRGCHGASWQSDYYTSCIGSGQMNFRKKFARRGLCAAFRPRPPTRNGGRRCGSGSSPSPRAAGARGARRSHSLPSRPTTAPEQLAHVLLDRGATGARSGVFDDVEPLFVVLDMSSARSTSPVNGWPCAGSTTSTSRSRASDAAS